MPPKKSKKAQPAAGKRSPTRKRTEKAAPVEEVRFDALPEDEAAEPSDGALTFRQQAFVMHYLINGFNATRAAIAAGYSEKSARFIGSENLTKPNIKAALSGFMKSMAMEAEEVLYRLTLQAQGDIGPYIQINEAGNLGINLDLMKAHGKTHLIKKISQTTAGITVEFHDSHAALIALGRSKGLFTDKVKVDATLTWEDVVKQARGDDTEPKDPYA